MAEIGAPASQTASKLLSLPGEMRNRIYMFTFENGEKSDLALLLACRLLYLEANLIAFRRMAIKIICTIDEARPHSYKTIFPSSLRNLRVHHRNSINTVKCYYHQRGCRLAAQICARHGIFPVHAVQFWKRQDYAEVSPSAGKKVLRYMRLAVAPSGMTGRSLDLHSLTPILGFFLLNRRLRSWTHRGLAASGDTVFEVTVRRETSDGVAMDEPTGYVCQKASVRLRDFEWLDQIAVEVIEEKKDEMFVVVISHPKRRGLGAIRLRFRLQVYEKKEVVVTAPDRSWCQIM